MQPHDLPAFERTKRLAAVFAIAFVVTLLSNIASVIIHKNLSAQAEAAGNIPAAQAK